MPLDPVELKVLERIRSRQDALESLLGELVSINSHTGNYDGVNAVGRLVERRLEECGLRVAAFVTGASAHHLIARSGTFDGHRLMLLGHLDTVFPPEFPGPDFAPDPHEPTRLRGPGVTDMKGGLVVMLAAVQALAEAGELDGRALSVVLTADEETGAPTARDILEQEGREHHLCLVLETGSDLGDGRTTFVTERKGCGRRVVEIAGWESHAGARKEDGLSAALEMAHQIIALEALNDPARGNSVNVGLARAGTAVNTVPGHARFEIDFRFADADEGADLADAIERICRQTHTRNEKTGAVPATKVIEGTSHPPLVRTDAVGRMATRLQTWGADLGLDLAEESRGGASDGSIVAAAGCPTVDGLGTVGGAIHSQDEWVDRASLVDRACLLALTMLRFFRL